MRRKTNRRRKEMTHSKFSFYFTLLAIAYMLFQISRDTVLSQGAILQTVFGIVGLSYIALENQEPLDPRRYNFRPITAESIGWGLFLAVSGIVIQTLLQIPATITTIEIAIFSICAAACEEVFFRGFVFTVLKKTLDTLPSVLLSALIFAISHYNYFDRPLLLLSLFLWGNLMALVYDRKDLTTAMLGHLFLNLVWVVQLLGGYGNV